jgi:hypothetical protein
MPHGQSRGPAFGWFDVAKGYIHLHGHRSEMESCARY